MTIRTLLFIEFQVLIVVVIAGLFVWRYWIQPKQVEAQRMAQVVQAPPPAAAPAPGAPAVASGSAPATPVPPGAPAAPVPAVSVAPGAPAVSAPTPAPAGRTSLLKNGNFSEGLANWSLWRDAKIYSNSVSIISVPGPSGARAALRIENPHKAQIGVQQLARVTSGSVYRLSAAVRSVAGHDTNVIFGGRVAFYLQPQREQEIVWMTEYNQWWRRELVFTNLVDGVATVYAHLGYGNVATTGEFTDIVLEKL